MVESLIGTRLERWAEAVNLLPDEQSGFRKGRSTVDCLVNLGQTAYDQLNTRKSTRTLITAVDFTAAFDRVWRSGLLQRLARAAVPHRWLRWLRAWLADRMGRVRWNTTLGKWRKLGQGVPQGSPLSPLLFIIATADIPEVIRSASPDVRPDLYADDLTLSAHQQDPGVAATNTQRALDALATWCDENYQKISPDKTEALVITTDPREVNGKCHPPLRLADRNISYNASPTILGVQFDSQLTFTGHVLSAAAKMRRRCSILRAVAARNWGANTAALRQLYIAFVRPVGLYAAAAWWPFTSASTRQRLEVANNMAARTITGLGAGSRATTTRRDADLASIDLIARKDTVSSFLRYRCLPADHFLHRLTLPPPQPARLKTRGTGNFRPSWRSTAIEALQEAGLDGTDPEPTPRLQDLPPPWASPENVSFHAVQGTSREAPPAVRRALALEFLATLRQRLPPDLEVWTDGAAVEGTRNGGGGFVIQWPAPGPDTIGSVPAGTVTSSTASEAAALAAALRVVMDELFESPRQYNIWLAFDSKCLHDRLRHPARSTYDSATAEALRRIHALACTHQVAILWVPGHAGLPLNERADEAARAGTRLAQPASKPSRSALTNRAARHLLNTADTRQYEAEVPLDHIHRRATAGEPLPLSKRRTRAADVALFQLRGGKAPFLRATQHRWGSADSPECPHCQAPQEDTDHFILHCPRWEVERRTHLGADLDISVLHHRIRDVLLFLETTGVLARPPYVA